MGLLYCCCQASWAAKLLALEVIWLHDKRKFGESGWLRALTFS